MTGNSVAEHQNATLLSVTEVEAPNVVTSKELDKVLAPTLKRLKLPQGLLNRVAGVRERRMWDQHEDYITAATTAARQALEEANVAAEKVGLLINASVTRTSLEPAVSVQIHDGLGLPSSAMNFDITNACLGFVNAMSVASTMIDSGQMDYAIVVAAEDASRVHENTINNLLNDDVDRDSFMMQFASLTLGCGAAAAVIGRADQHPEGHRILRGVTRSGTQFHNLCAGDHNGMYTDAEGLLVNGLDVVMGAMNEAPAEWDWFTMDKYITHQVSKIHTETIMEKAGIPKEKIPVTFPQLGNIGPAALPITLARDAKNLSAGDRVLCLGVGSGINAAMLEIKW